jgi:hypothetical protein
MAHTSLSGEKFTNMSQKMAADRKYGSVPIEGAKIGDGRQPVKSFSKPEPARQPTAKPVKASAESLQDPAQALADHGPANSVSIEHSGDKHTVRSTHADGHEHRSTYDSPESAHEAAATLAGVDNNPEAPQDFMGAM